MSSIPNPHKVNRKMAFFSDCENHLHSFYKSPHTDGSEIFCRECQSTPVKWQLTRSRDLNLLKLVVAELKKEWWRHFWWHIQIEDKVISKAKQYSLEDGYLRVQKRISISLSRMYNFNGKYQPFNDGYQTPYSGNIIYYAQHAMATCCRTCIEYWHGIPQGRELVEQEIDYLSELTFFYVKSRINE